jgi:uncharacterized protein
VILVQRTEIIWEQTVEYGLEHMILRQDKNIEADSLALGMIDGAAYRIRYQIICDLDWRLERVKVEDLLNLKELVLVKKAEGVWMDEGGHPIDALNGCIDVDIKITPFTNTLPIRRLNLALHESKEISVVYFSVPELSFSKMDQRYTFLLQEKDFRVYKYESLNSGFTSDIKVDANGLVIDYPGIFKMVWKELL